MDCKPTEDNACTRMSMTKFNKTLKWYNHAITLNV